MKRLTLAAALLVACTRDGVEYGSTRDMRDLLERKGVKVATLACRNIREGGQVTRALACETTLDPTQRSKLIGTMLMKPFKPTFISPAQTFACEQTAGFSSSLPTVDVFRGFEPNSGWTYYALYVDRTTGRVCFETAYAWSS